MLEKCSEVQFAGWMEEDAKGRMDATNTIVDAGV